MGRGKARARVLGGLGIVWTAFFCGATAYAGGQQVAAQADPVDAPVLTLDEAVAMALKNNRNVKLARLNVDASRQQYLVAKTKRYPVFNADVFGGETLLPISFTIKEGQLGKDPANVPIPSTDRTISASQTPTAFVVAQATQPLLALYKVDLNLRGQKLAVAQTAEQLRGARQTISAGVHQAYYGIVQAEQAVASTKASIQQYEELDRITTEYVKEKTALRSDLLAVEVKLAQEKLALMQSEDKVESAKESLNELLGRDINTPVRTTAVAAVSLEETDLQAAQAAALRQHPEIAEAGLTVEQASIQRRLAKAQYLPDLNATFRFISPFGIDFLPTNIAAIGLEFKWDPFDWGARAHTVQQKAIVLEQSKQQLEETKAQVLVNVDNQFRALKEARATVSVAGANRQAASEKLRETTAQFGQKTALLRDVLQQQAASEAADAQYVQAEAAFWTAKANFQNAVGEE